MYIIRCFITNMNAFVISIICVYILWYIIYIFYKNSINYTYIHNISFKNFELFFWTLRFFLQRVYICMYVCMYVWKSLNLCISYLILWKNSPAAGSLPGDALSGDQPPAARCAGANTRQKLNSTEKQCVCAPVRDYYMSLLVWCMCSVHTYPICTRS